MSASKAQQAAAAERRRRAIALKIAGLDYQAIADQLSYASRGAAYTDIDRALKKAREEERQAAELLRDIEVQRYDRLQAAYWPKAVKGDTKSADIVLKCITGRTKLQGTEAPARVSVEAQQLSDEITELLGKIAGRRDTRSS